MNNEFRKPIFPLVPGEKVPAKNAMGFSDPVNYEKLRSLCKPGENYGLLMGKNTGLFCLDFDLYKSSKEEKEKFTLENFKEQFGDDVYVTETPRGGYHVVFEYEPRFDDWKQTTGINGFIDTRTTGGYIVGAGSTTKHGEYKRLNGDILKPTRMPTKLADDIEYNSKIINRKVFTGGFADDANVEKALEDFGFSGINWKKDYSFNSDQNGQKCPCCGNVHDNNCWKVSKADDTGSLFVKNFSDKCESKLLVRGTKDQLPSCAFILENENGENKILAENKMPTAPVTEVFTGTSHTISGETNVTVPTIKSYEEMKREFEKSVCRVEEGLIYPVVEKDKTHLDTKEKLKERKSHLKFWNGKHMESFVNAWLDDENKRAYTRMDIYPKDCPKDVFNRWEDFTIVKENIPSGEGDVTPFTDLLWDLVGGEQESYVYALKWIAYLIQYPEKKPQTALCFHGSFGIGKNLLFELIGERVMGSTHYFETSNPLDTIFGTHSTQPEGKKLIFVDEMESSIQRKVSERLKSNITNPAMTINPKGVQEYTVKHLAGYVFAGNGFIVKIEEGDRRFVLYDAIGKYIHSSKEGQDFVKNWLVWREDPKNLKAVYDLLMKTPTDIEYLKHKRPITSYYREIRHKSLPYIIKWLEYMIWDFPLKYCKDAGKGGDKDTDPNIESKVSTEDLMRAFKYTFTSRNLVTDAVTFGGDLTRLHKDKKLPFTKGRLTGGIRGWTFKRKEVFDWLKKNEYTLHELYEEPYLDEKGEVVDNPEEKEKLYYYGLPAPVTGENIFY